MRTILVVLAALSFQTIAHATPADDAGIQASLDARNAFVTALENKDFTTITHDTMDAIIHDIAALISVKDAQMAADLLSQWEQSSPTFAAAVAHQVQAHNLGDHPPLFPWLATFMNNLTSKYAEFTALPIVGDIIMLNYAIPVVFTPHGSWESPDVDNRIEYRRHFIPFVNLITYYSSYYGCKYALAHYNLSDLKKICPKAATKLEWVMGRYIAPHVSDWIFNAANHANSSSLIITDNELQYETVEQLRAAIQ